VEQNRLREGHTGGGAEDPTWGAPTFYKVAENQNWDFLEGARTVKEPNMEARKRSVREKKRQENYTLLARNSKRVF